MSDVKVCKVMTSYGTTLVVLVPNSSNYNALTSAIEKKHANLYGNLYGEVRVTRMDGFLHENDEGAGIGVSYPVDDESFRSIPFTNYLAQLHSKKGGEKAGNSSAKKIVDAKTIDVLSPKSLIDANVKAAARGPTPISIGPSRFQGDSYYLGGETTTAAATAAPQVPSLKSRFASEAPKIEASVAKKSKKGTVGVADAQKPVTDVVKAKTPPQPSSGQATASKPNAKLMTPELVAKLLDSKKNNVRFPIFAKSLQKHSGFKSACDKLSGDSAQKAYASAKEVVGEIKKCQAEVTGSGNVYEETLEVIQALSPKVNGPSAPLITICVIVAKVYPGGYKAKKGLPTRVWTAMIGTMKERPNTFNEPARMVLDKVATILGYDQKLPTAVEGVIKGAAGKSRQLRQL